MGSGSQPGSAAGPRGHVPGTAHLWPRRGRGHLGGTVVVAPWWHRGGFGDTGPWGRHPWRDFDSDGFAKSPRAPIFGRIGPFPESGRVSPAPHPWVPPIPTGAQRERGWERGGDWGVAALGGAPLVPVPVPCLRPRPLRQLRAPPAAQGPPGPGAEPAPLRSRRTPGNDVGRCRIADAAHPPSRGAPTPSSPAPGSLKAPRSSAGGSPGPRAIFRGEEPLKMPPRARNAGGGTQRCSRP